MMCRILLQKLTGHISEVSNQSKLSDVVSLWTQNVCQFSKKFEGVKIFFVDLAWNNPYAPMDEFSVYNEYIGFKDLSGAVTVL